MLTSAACDFLLAGCILQGKRKDAGAHCVTDAFATSHRPVLQTTSLPSFLTYNNVGVLPLLTFKIQSRTTDTAKHCVSLRLPPRMVNKCNGCVALMETDRAITRDSDDLNVIAGGAQTSMALSSWEPQFSCQTFPPSGSNVLHSLAESARSPHPPTPSSQSPISNPILLPSSPFLPREIKLNGGRRITR
ncbi:hypothetical protein IAS59_005396 [Cryptococcus gattii]